MTSPASRSEDELDVANLQGISLAGFRKIHQHLSFVEFGSAEAGKRLINALAPLVANDTEVRRYNAVFSEIRRRRGSNRRAGQAVQATWIGFAISGAGYATLGIDVTAEGTGLPAGSSRDAFVAGMASRAAQTGDTGLDDPASWQVGIAGAHALIVIASDNTAHMNDVISAIDELVADSGCTVTFKETGRSIGGESAHDHFGFKDGVSQPKVRGYGADGSDADAIAPGEFVLGFPDQNGTPAPVGPMFTSGSYLVFRRLVQDVDGFHAQAQAGAGQVAPTVSPELFAAKMVGRWPSGAPLELHPDNDPGPSGVSNDFTYAAAGDDDGHLTPQWAHIRKVNPRDETQPAPPEDPARHRMIRRGLTFSKSHEKGLHFIALVGDLERQFEFVQHRWSDDPNFPNGAVQSSPGSGYGPPVDGRPGAGPDPVSGHRPDNAPVGYVAGQGETPQPVPLLHQFVQVTGGEYFFAPSIAALANMGEA